MALSRARSVWVRSRVWMPVSILLLAFALRLPYLADKEIWYDEAFAALYAQNDLASIVAGTITPVDGAAADIHPLLYYFFLHGWMLIGDSPFVLRFPSVVFGVMAIAVLARLGRESFDRRTAKLAALLAAVSPFHIWYSQEARMYSLLCLLSLASIYFFVRAWKENGWRDWFSFGVLTGLSLYVHNLAFLVPVTLDLVTVVGRRWNALRRLIAANVIAVIIFLPWLVLVPGQLAKVRQAYWVPTPGPAELVRTLIVFTFNLPLPQWLLPVCLFYSMLLLSMLLYLSIRPAQGRKKTLRWPSGLTLALSFLPPFFMYLVSQIRAIYVERALLVSALAYYLGLSHAALRGRVPRLVAATLIPVPVLLASSLWYQYHYDQFPRSPYRELNAYLREHIQPRDVVIHDNKLSFFPSHYYDRSLPQEYIGDAPGSATDTLALPTQKVLGLMAQPDVAHAVGRSSRIWFVVFQRALDEAQEMGAANASKSWLDTHYQVMTEVTFRDLRLLLYEPS
jgi:mannosyltransferase